MDFRELYDDEETQRFVIEGHTAIRMLKRLADTARSEARIDAVLTATAAAGSAIAFASGAPEVGGVLVAGVLPLLSVTMHHFMRERDARNEVELTREKIQIAGANSHVRGSKYRIRPPGP
jgi:hypothetical protein